MLVDTHAMRHKTNMLVVRVDSRIRMSADALDADTIMRLKKACEHVNPDFAKKRSMGYATYNVPAVVKTWKHEVTARGSTLTFPRGAMSRVREQLAKSHVAFRVVDARSEGSVLAKPLQYVGHDPRSYQREAAAAALKREQGVIRAATGSGKTTTLLWLAAHVGLNSLVILPSVKLLDQTVEVAGKLLGLHGPQIGVLQGAKRRLRPLTVATQQTLWSRSVDDEVRDYFGAVFIDEAHHAAAKTFGESIDQFPARYRFAFTADERRKDRKEFLVYDAFGDVLHETSREKCEEVGAVVDVEVRILLTNFRAEWYAGDPDFNKLLEAMTSDEERDGIAITHALDELRSGEQLIMLTHRREHAHALERALVVNGIKSGCMLGGAGADGVEFDRSRTGLRDGSVRAGVGTYEALGEGIDLPAVAVGFATTPIATNKQRFNQVRGRLCRPSEGKTHGRLYVMFDRHVFDERAYANILAWNRTVKVFWHGQWVDARSAKRVIMSA